MVETRQHRLAAVIAADVAGYSRLMRLDEEATMAAWWSYRKEVIDPMVADHGGRVVKLTGDGFLAEFSSTMNAVSAAVAMQSEIASRVADIDEDRRVQFRMGVNLGDILWDDEDIYGDGVNIAARIEALAPPGGICISGAVFEQISGATDQKFDDLGYKTLKNITQPVRIYQIRFTEAYTEGETLAGFHFAAGAHKREPMACGGCLCGNVRYETWAEPLAAGYCHCRFCQLAQGAPLNAWVCFEEKFVNFIGDAPKIYRSSPITERAFCGNCGTNLYTYFGAADSSEFYYGIRLATLDNPQDFPLKSHECVESQLPGLDIKDGLPRFRTEDDPGLAARWAAVGQPKTGITLGTAVERLNAARKV